MVYSLLCVQLNWNQTCYINTFWPNDLTIKKFLEYWSILVDQTLKCTEITVEIVICILLTLIALTIILTLWLPNKIFRNCHLAPNKIFGFSPLAPNKIFGFSFLAPNKIWLSTFPPTTDRMILFSEKNIGPM